MDSVATGRKFSELEKSWLAFFAVTSIILFVTRFFMPGHPVSLWGAVESFAHIWVGFAIAAAVFYRRASIQTEAEVWFRWVVVALMLFPSLFELYKFLVGPFNTIGR